MTLMTTKFTPEVLLSAPRRSAAHPNCKGTKALFTVTSYSFENHKKTTQVRLLDIATGQSTQLYESPKLSDPTWLTETEFLLVRAGQNGGSSLVVGDSSRPGSEPTEIKAFCGTIANLKVRALSDGIFALACSASATPKGDMAVPESEKKNRPHSTARVYDSLFVRHWDTWVGEARNAIWYGRLERAGDSKSGAGGAPYALAGKGLVNALAGTGLASPVPPFGGAGDFDLGPAGLAFVAKDRRLCEASYTKTDLHFVALSSFTESPAPAPRPVDTGALRGYSASPTFSRDGKKLVFTRMRSRQYESDKPRLLLVPDIAADPANVQEFYATEDGGGGWDARPESIVWSAGDAELFVTAEEHGRNKLWRLPAEPRVAGAKLPEPLTEDGSVASVALLASDGGRGDNRLFVSSSSAVDSSCYSIVDPGAASAAERAPRTVSSATKHGRTFGLSRAQLDEFWFRGAGEYDVHALVMKPSGFDAKKKYPLALFIHGGPQGAWMDGWSTRWNPAIFAEAGYVVVCPNPTGSTGYGMDLQNGIKGQWGGRPYNDLVNCFEHVKDNFPHIDTENAVALGASYGGYMINWIQGNALGRKFKALVCHDGVFSTLSQWTTEELFFPIHDFEGTLWENREGYEKWDPARLVDQWATPQLIIHSELDYRLPITEGIGPFNVLQARGVPSRFLMFPDENHWVLKPENSLVWHREVLGWINKYTGLDKANNASEAHMQGMKVS